MLDPLSLLVGAGLLVAGGLVGLLAGWLLARRQRREPQPVCGCDHHRSMHADGGAGECMVAVDDEPAYNAAGVYVGRRSIGCACQQYIGPEPIPSDFWVPPVLPEGSDR